MITGCYAAYLGSFSDDGKGYFNLYISTNYKSETFHFNTVKLIDVYPIFCELNYSINYFGNRQRFPNFENSFGSNHLSEEHDSFEILIDELNKKVI